MSDHSVIHGTAIRNPEEILAKLKEPFPPDVVEQKPGGRGKMLDYIPGWAVEERLDEATGGIWSAELLWTEADRIMVSRKDGIVPRDVVYSFIRLTIPGLGTRVGRGVQVKEEGSGEDVVKGAETDGLKVAAAKFGVARYLYRGGSGAPQQQNQQGYSNNQGGNNNYGQQRQGGNFGGGQRQGDPVTEAQWGKFNAMTQKLGIDPNSIIKAATNGFDMNNVNKRGMSMTIDKLTKIESGEERWDGPAPQQTDAGNSGRFGQQQAPPPAAPTKDQLLGRIHGANSGSELDSIYDEMVMLMIQDDPELMTALGDRANQLGG